jgi:soluble cytochrome b562
MENENENPDSLNETVPPATETAEERLSRLEETNKKLYERTKKAEADAKEAKAELIKVKPAISEVSAKPSETKPSDILKADEFKLYRAGYTESEIDLIMHNGGAKILEDKKNPLVMGLIAAKEQRGAEDAASRTSDSSGLSDIERKYTEQDMRNMTKEDLEKLIPHVVK